jgi:hypothetical protein
LVAQTAAALKDPDHHALLATGGRQIAEQGANVAQRAQRRVVIVIVLLVWLLLRK